MNDKYEIPSQGNDPFRISDPKEVVWFDLIMRCPACLAKGVDPGPEALWYHSLDNDKIQVGNNAEYKCTGCNYMSHVRNWRYACKLHETDYRPTSSEHLANALSVGGQFASQGGREWLQRFLDNLGQW
jgi:hypothetical protein